MDSSTSNREMRDQVLQLLLSGQKSQRSTTRTARASMRISSSRDRGVPFEAWTPGAHLGNPEVAGIGVLSPPPVSNRRNAGNDAAGGNDNGILSPITPETRGRASIGTTSNGNLFNGPSYARLPMDADLRLAEITAGLVAATDKERRQTDTIRRLAIQLERSEIQVKILQKTSPPHESTPPARRKSRKRRDDNYDRNPHDGGNENVDILYELEELRRQRREWRQKDKTSKKEARAAANLLSDITRRAERVISERDVHLRRIASLQQQLHEQMHGVEEDVSPAQAENFQDSVDIPSRRAQVPIPPRPALSLTSQTTHSGKSQSNNRNHLPAEDESPRKVSEEQDTQTPGKRLQHVRSPGSTQSERIVRPQEHISRSGSLPYLPSCTPNEAEDDSNGIDGDATAAGETVGQTESGGGQTHLYQDLHELLAENKALKAKLESRESRPVNIIPIPEELEELDDELGALESVVEAMELSLNTDEAKEMQLTMSTLGLGTGGFERKKPSNGVNDSRAKTLAQRVKDVKELIASKYGKYLADFGPSSGDDTLSLPPGVTLDSLQEHTEISLSRTVAPEVNANDGGLENEEQEHNVPADEGGFNVADSAVEESSPSRATQDDDVNDVQ